MTKLIAVIAGLALGTLGVASVQLASSGEPSRTASVGTTGGGSATATDDGVTTTGRERGEDLRGPCEEAEHAGDPRCAGAATVDDADDRSNRGSSGDDQSRSSGSRGDDSSGHGSADRSGDERSGHGSGSDDHSGSSGHGSDRSGDDSSGGGSGYDD